MLELGVVLREGDGNCRSGSVLGAGGNATQLKLAAQPLHFIDMKDMTQQKCGAC